MKYTKVTSLSNPVIKEAIRIRKKPDRQRAFLIEGPHPVEMAAASPGVDIKRVFFTEDFASEREGQRLLKQAAKRTAHLIETSGQILS
ncbi:MAG: hypothetical protein HY099_02645 [Nitrospirae bacterium]|nr:hypothetical protein [Nitrospirota bacterium]